MVKGGASESGQSPAPTPALKKSTSSTQNMKNQKSILGFFQAKTPGSNLTPSRLPERPTPSTQRNGSAKGLTKKLLSKSESTQSLTPAPSSDAVDPDEADEDEEMQGSSMPRKTDGLPSPVSPADGAVEEQAAGDLDGLTSFGTPSRKVSIFSSKCHYNWADRCEGQEIQELY